MQALVAEGAGAVGEREWHHDNVAPLHGADVRADLLDDADRLVAHALPGLGALHRGVGPEVAAADAGAGDADQRVGWFGERRIADFLGPDVAGGVHDRGKHDLHISADAQGLGSL